MECVKEKSYYYYATSGYESFMHLYNNGIITEEMLSMAQNSCERYLKHVIDKYEIVDKDSREGHIVALHSHGLKYLLHYINDRLHVRVSKDLAQSLSSISKYYYVARYPINGSVFACEANICDCYIALRACREFADRTCETFELLKDKKSMQKLTRHSLGFDINELQLQTLIQMLPKPLPTDCRQLAYVIRQAWALMKLRDNSFIKRLRRLRSKNTK